MADCPKIEQGCTNNEQPKKRVPGVPFTKDDPRRGRGRKKGQKNRVTVEAKEAAEKIVDDPEYRLTLLSRARSGGLAPAVETMLWAYAKGKPKETIEVTGTLTLESALGEILARRQASK